MNDNRDAIDFSAEPVEKLFRKMFFPTLIGMVSMVVLNITDGAFVGHGVGSDALAAVNIVAPLFMIFSGIGLMFGIGSSVVASIHFSRGNSHAANINLTQGVLASVFVGIVVAAIVFFNQEAVCRLFGCTDGILEQACSYIKWIALLSPFNMFGLVGMFMVRLDGAPRFAMLMNCATAFLNILLDYIFIYPLQLGLEGAAMATSLAFGVGSIPLMFFLFSRTKTVHFHKLKHSPTSIRLTIRNLAYQMKIGSSALLGEVAISSIIIVGNYVFMHYLGEDGVAAYSVGCYCLPIVFMIGNAIIQSVQPIVSFAYGAGNRDRMKKSLSIALYTAAATGIAGMLFVWFGADAISTVFLDTTCNAYQICKDGMPYFSPSFLCVSLNLVLIGYMQSTEQVRGATAFTILRGFVFSIPAFVFAPMVLGVKGIWLALPMAELATLLIIILRFQTHKFQNPTD